MTQKQLVTLALVAGLVVLIYRRRQQLASLPLNPESEQINGLVATPEEDAAWWAFRSGGSPSAAGSRGAGEVNPVTKLLDNISRVFAGEVVAWGAPNAATGPAQLSFSPPGATIPPGPVPPGQPTPQGATESSSPWLPSDLALAAPLSANPWMMELSASDPWSIIAGGGGFIDVEPVSAV
jgi:hypothetical protein